MKKALGSTSDAGSALKCELAAEVLRSFGTLRFAEMGWSMVPSIWPGETLMFERIDRKEVRIGDIVLVCREGRLCTHRVVGMAGEPDNPKWITQGDALSAPDRPVAANELLGKLAYLVRAGKLVAVQAELTVINKFIAQAVRRSFAAARALVYLNRMRQTSKELVLPCRG
jgi:signal peptidase I